jgi:glycosyltransferase involved in cell wall biosynthesis
MPDARGGSVRIVFISLFRLGFGGGGGQAAHELARQFARRHEVVLICPHDHTLLYQAEGGLRVLGIQSGGEGNVSVPVLSEANLARLLSFLDEFQPEIIHAHDPVSLALVGQIWAKTRGVPFVYTSHVLTSRFMSFGAVEAFRGIGGALTDSVASQFLSSFYDGCDAIVALNESARADLGSFGYRGRILMIPNGRDLDRYQSCQLANPSAREKTLVFVGFVSERKNQLYLLEALQFLSRDYRLQLVGQLLDAGYGQQLKRLIRVRGLRNVTFAGQVEYDAIRDYLEGAHLFVSASTMEVQSLSVIEALASGTPVVGLSNETIDELVDDQVGRRLPKDASPRTFAEAVDGVCHLMPREYDQLCRQARQRVAPFGWPNVVSMTETAYRSLIEDLPPVTQQELPRIMDVVTLIPSEEIRDALAQRVIALDRAMHRIPPESTLSLIRSAKSVSRPTRVYVLLTLILSGLAYVVVQSRRYLRRAARRASAEGELRRATTRNQELREGKE